MRNPIFDLVDKKYRRADQLDFNIGDTVVVTLRIAEGSKERLQDFEGTVISRKGHGLDEMFTVRRLVGDEGVERCFPLHSPKIASIKTRRAGKVRRCKLYYLRQRVGKARKLKELRISADAKRAAAEARAARSRADAEAAEVVATSRGKRKAELAATPS
jgi:large subunit ribosomal protein L19